MKSHEIPDFCPGACGVRGGGAPLASSLRASPGLAALGGGRSPAAARRAMGRRSIDCPVEMVEMVENSQGFSGSNY